MKTAGRVISWLVVIQAACASAAFDRAESHATPIQPRADGSPLKIACIGDSITYGLMVSPDIDDYRTVLGRLLGKHF
jgi:hypothetical protein